MDYWKITIFGLMKQTLNYLTTSTGIIVHIGTQKNHHIVIEQQWDGISSFDVMGPSFLERTIKNATYLKILYSLFLMWCVNMLIMLSISNCRTCFYWYAFMVVRYHIYRFFFWGMIKNNVYGRNPKTLDELTLFIEEVFEDIDENTHSRYSMF